MNDPAILTTMKKKSWKTTATGLTAIASSLVMVWFKRHELTEATVMAAITGIITGIGLISARDSDVTSEGRKTN